MKLKLLAASAAVAIAAASTPANALTFTFVDGGGVSPTSQAYYSFRAAANYWSSMMTNNVNVTLQLGYFSFGPGGEDILGSAGSARSIRSISNYQTRVQNTRSSSGVDNAVQIYRPQTDTNGAIDMITPGYTDPVAQTGIDNSTRVWDDDATVNNRFMYTTTANAKAIGAVFAPGLIDAQIQFNSDFAFDFDPTDDIDAGKVDFTLVALHEIGHALGFVSGVDDYDVLGAPNGTFAQEDCGGFACQDYPAEDDYWGSSLDMFRYGSNREGLGGGGPKLDWAIRNPLDPSTGYVDFTDNPYFSLDGGATKALGFEAYFSRGQDNGASFQASHFRRAGANNGPGNPAQPFLGIMDPVGQTGNYVTALDLAAFDAIGWNTRVDAMANVGYTYTTAQVFAQSLAEVPEPSQWALMLGGFGLLGGALRRRKATVRVTYA